ncbi:exported protein of unknown function [Nitrosotalea devaniterrae]|uniref:Uncharacterized protein n=1 Tax=Nitrosotalea devaniterrae TaxID=1078905 RepID=A0A128A236_9ARCH|nr:exported protein of unknown function [Candidatus Nitrosotalea devanaterra]
MVVPYISRMKITFFGIPILFVLAIILSANHAYAPCIEGPGIDCNGYPPHALTQINSDKLNYEISDKPVIIIVGVPYTVVHLEIDDSSSNIVFTHEINLSSNGTARYILDISSYKPGVYSAIANSLTSKLTTGFAVGLASPGGQIMLNTDKNSYLPGDNIAILGAWNPDTLVQLLLIDPSGISVKSIQTFSDKTGHFSSSDITIPLNAISGIWQISATSGVSHTQVQITINSTNNFARNITNSTSMPPNAIRTQNGGWITPLQTTDQNGNNLTIHYEGQGIDVTGKVLPSPAVPNLITHNMFSPLPQFKSGVNTNDIICKEGLYLAIKSHDKEPTCLKAGTISKLASRGFLYGINDNHTNYTDTARI